MGSRPQPQAGHPASHQTPGFRTYAYGHQDNTLSPVLLFTNWPFLSFPFTNFWLWASNHTHYSSVSPRLETEAFCSAKKWLTSHFYASRANGTPCFRLIAFLFVSWGSAISMFFLSRSFLSFYFCVLFICHVASYHVFPFQYISWIPTTKTPKRPTVCH